LGPRGTGKSHLFQQVSPYSHLVSGGKATVARMFVNNASGQRGLVCQYDVVCFDEVSGVSFDSKDGVTSVNFDVFFPETLAAQRFCI
jgi:ATP-dependent Lon protease